MLLYGSNYVICVPKNGHRIIKYNKNQNINIPLYIHIPLNLYVLMCQLYYEGEVFTLCLFCNKFAPFEMSASLCSSFLGCLQLLGDSRNKVVLQFIYCLCFHFYSLIRMTYTIVVCQANIEHFVHHKHLHFFHSFGQ